jgi:hypothetical protein
MGTYRMLNKSTAKAIANGVKMSKPAKPLPLRQCDYGKWEVENVPGNCVKCETKEDAEILSNAPIVLDESYKTMFPNKALAARLERTAEKLEQYKMGTAARFFKSRAELVRGN